MATLHRGTCSVCRRVRAVTARGVVRSHLTPTYGSRRRWDREVCDGTGRPPGNIKEVEEVEPSDKSERFTDMGLVVLVHAYNEMHQQLCPQGEFCSAHQEGFALVRAVWREATDRDLLARARDAVDRADPNDFVTYDDAALDKLRRR